MRRAFVFTGDNFSVLAVLYLLEKTLMAKKLSEKQKKVLRDITSFLSHRKKNIFLLKGYAGTGKTFLLAEIAAYAVQNNRFFRFMAPTGRAARVLQQKTGFHASTIHRVIYKYKNEIIQEKNKTHTVCYEMAFNKDPESTIYIIDESSMISNLKQSGESLRFGSGRLLSDLISFISPGNTSRKIIFCGDPAQLEPIRMSFSPAMDPYYLKASYKATVSEALLTEIYRQNEGNSIISTSMALRKELEKKTPDSISIGPDGDQIHQRPVSEDYKAYRKAIEREKVPSAIWICHKNTAVEEVNKEMRMQLSFFPETLCSGEILVVTSNHYHSPCFFLNGDQLKVCDVSEEVERRKVVFNYRQKKGITLELSFREISVYPITEPHEIYSVKIIENSLHDFETGKLKAALFVDFLHRHKKKPAGLFEAAKKTDSCYNALFVRYGYAMTCHKAQGGEWKTVYLDLRHSYPVWSKSFLRWAYTGLTRASEEIYLQHPVSYRANKTYVVEPIRLLKETNYLVPDYREPEIQETDNPVFRSFPFLKGFLLSLENITEEKGYKMQIEHFVHKMHLFIKNFSSTSIYEISYTKDAIKKEIKEVSGTDKTFSRRVFGLLASAIQGESFCFEPKEKQRIIFYGRLKKFCFYFRIRLRGVKEDPWCDTFILDTDMKGSQLRCCYNSAGKYTKITPYSLMGCADGKMENLVGYLKAG